MSPPDLTHADAARQRAIALVLTYLGQRSLPQQSLSMTLKQLQLDSLDLLDLQCMLSEQCGLVLERDAIDPDMRLRDLVDSLRPAQGDPGV